MPDLSLETVAYRDGHEIVCGVDEAGRGPWAGPVVAAAVVLGPLADDPSLLAALDDSKKLSARRRDALFETIGSRAAVGVGMSAPDEIDAVNILEATFRAMARAVAVLDPPPDLALVDGNRAPVLSCETATIVRGDGISASIAAASIIAKVTRDRLMAELAISCPGYGWERNAGYGTAEHSRALADLGVTDHHRKSFKPVRRVIEQARPQRIS